MRIISFAVAFGIATLSVIPSQLRAQEPVLIAASDHAPGLATAATAATSASAQVSKTPHALTERWLDVTAFSHSERYRNAFATGGPHNFDNAQQRSLISGSIKLDAGGR